MADHLTAKEMMQLLVSGAAPFVAVGGALVLAAYQRRERIAFTIGYGMTYGYDAGPEEGSFLIVHNLSNQTVAISRVRYLKGFPRRPAQGTALQYMDPTELDFPYVVGPGEIRKLLLSDGMAKRVAEEVSGPGYLWARLFRRPRLVVEATTTTGLKRRTEGESVLNWADRAPWMRQQ